MNSDHYIVFAGDGQWRVACVRDGSASVRRVDSDVDATIETRAEAACGALVELGHAGQPVVLAVPSSWCLCATISTDGLPRTSRRDAMAFRLEEHLPISAEEVVADYVKTGPREALGVCGEREKLESIVAALAARGVAVRHICPEAMLAAAHAAETCGRVDCVLVAAAAGDAADAESSGAGMDMIELRGGKCVRWLWLADDESVVGQHLAALAESCGGVARVAALGCGESIRGLCGSGGAVDIVEPRAAGAEEAAAMHAAGILDEVATPWIDLRCGAMASGGAARACCGPLAALVAAAAMGLLCVCGTMLWRGMQYAAMAQQYDSRQAEVFRDALPGQRVPRVGVMARLRSERQRLEVIGGRPSGSVQAGAGDRPSALGQLRDILAGLPVDMRYRIVDLSIQPDMIRVDGEARSYADADRLAAGMRQSGTYDVDPAKMQALKDGGVSFIFTARPHRGSAPTKEGN